MANPLKIIEQGISGGDWEKVVKGFNALTGKTIKAPKVSSKSVKASKPAKVVTKTKEVIVEVYKADPSLLTILDFYKDAKNYQLSNGRIEILFDGGEKARSYIVPEEEQVEDYIVEPLKEKQTKSKTKKITDHSSKNQDDFFSNDYKPKPLIIKANDPEPFPNVYPKNKVIEYRDEDDSLEIVEYKCDRCNRMKQFRKMETRKEINGRKMDIVCNECNGGR